MWKRISAVMQCPICRGSLRLHAKDETTVVLPAELMSRAEERRVAGTDFTAWVETGAFTCESCTVVFPIAHGLPVFVPYTTPLHAEFQEANADWLRGLGDYRFPGLTPVSGEDFVMRSFSTEWLAYDYDGVIWDLSYEDHEKRFLAEIGDAALADGRHGTFLEIGCGIGLTTYFAEKNLEGDAIGVDLSLASLRACTHFRENPFLHFVQASAFYLPLRDDTADVVYSHGVLHHTVSTRDAVAAVAPKCKSGGWMYIWLYGPASLGGSVARSAAFRLERTIRPRIARNLESLGSRLALGALAGVYLVFNAIHHMKDSTVERYSYQHALHAARDRFTPLYAHRHSFQEVAGWFRELGFTHVEQVDWKSMPTANQPNYKRNTGVRGVRSATVPR